MFKPPTKASVVTQWMPFVFDLEFEKDALDLLVAIFVGGLIGFERQWRRREAGLRTNTLVALGAAIFVVFENHFDSASPTRVAAQVVSGIGFLGAGVIWKEGVNVRGLNTAATLWCSGAAGLLAGSGQWGRALTAALLVASVNLVLRPLVKVINRQPIEGAEVETSYTVTVICQAADEARIRALLVQGSMSSELHLHHLESRDIEGSSRVEVTAILSSEKRSEVVLETIVGRLSLEPGVTAARWGMTNGFL